MTQLAPGHFSVLAVFVSIAYAPTSCHNMLIMKVCQNGDQEGYLVIFANLNVSFQE